MRLATLNVKGAGRTVEKILLVLKSLRASGVDIVFLTESHLTNYRCRTYGGILGGADLFTSCPSPNSEGVTALVLNTGRIKDDSCRVCHNSNNGRYLGIECVVEGQTVRILGVYGPNLDTESKQFFSEVGQVIDSWKPHLVLGDFNKTVDLTDRNPPRLESPGVRIAMYSTLEEKGYIDGWREIAGPQGKGYTFTSTNATASSSRLDRIYAANRAYSWTTNWSLADKFPYTDHRMVTVDVHPAGRIETGPGRWGLKTYLLNNRVMRDKVSETIRDKSRILLKRFKKHNCGSEKKPVWWFELVDRGMAGTALHEITSIFDAATKTLRDTQKKVLQSRDRKIRKSQTLVDKLEALHRSKKLVKKLRKVTAKRDALLRERDEQRSAINGARWAFEGHGLGKSFWRLGRPPNARNTIPGLYNSKGKTTRKTSKMLSVTRRFYKKLYAAQECSRKAQKEILTFVEPAKFRDLNRPVKSTETNRVIQHWSSGSCPGPSGVPYEFFKSLGSLTLGEFCFTDILTMWLTLLVEFDKYGVTIPTKYAKGEIRIMHKKGDALDLANYRPLSMTEALYKLFTGVLNNRLVPAFVPIIGKHQTGFMPGRQIVDNVKLAQVMIDAARIRGEPLYIAFLDQEKAYDKVDHEYLWKVLKKHGLPNAMVQCIKGIYDKSRSTVVVNGFQSKKFTIGQGARQGDPLSCLLFNIAIDPLAKMILAESKLCGFKDSWGCHHKVSMYADDTAVYLKALREWKTVRKLYTVYAKASGARLNVSKTKILAVDNEGPQSQTYKGIEVIRGIPIEYLGVPVGEDVDESVFWKKRMSKIISRVKQWSRINTSRWARVRISNTVLESTLWYHLKCMSPKESVLADAQRRIFRFIHKTADSAGKCMGVTTHADSLRPRAEGGMGILDISAMRKALCLWWIQALERGYSDPPKAPVWQALAEELFRTVDPPKQALSRPWFQKWYRQRSPKFPPSINQFWVHWVEHRDSQPYPETREQVLNTVFWFHPNIYNQRNGAIKWGANCWLEMAAGIPGEKPPILTIQDILQVANDASAPQGWKGAAKRIQKEFPQEWLTLLDPAAPRVLNDNDETPEKWPLMVTPGRGISDTHTPVMSSNKQRYSTLLKDTVAKGQKGATAGSPKVLLSTFRQLCGRYNVSLEGIKDSEIWRGVAAPGTDYPKLSDLIYSCLHDRVSTGREFMRDEGFCPTCKEVQTAEHLFWRCPIAKKAWARMEWWWKTAKDSLALPRIQSYPELLLCGVRWDKMYDDAGDRRRWRLLWGETMFAIWVVRCAWSFEEETTLSPQRVLARLDMRVRLRVLADLQRALNELPETLLVASYQKTWALDDEWREAPGWL